MTNKKRLVATPMAADLNIMSVIPGPRLTARFLNYYFRSVDMRLLGSGSSIPQINNYDIEPLKIAVPNETEQCSFVAKADALNAEILKLTECYRRKLIELSQLKQSLLRQAFTGELTAAMPETIAA
jgi:type I restriction enzyme S subunit